MTGKPDPSDWKCNQGRGYEDEEDAMPDGAGIVVAIVLSAICIVIGMAAFNLINGWTR